MVEPSGIGVRDGSVVRSSAELALQLFHRIERKAGPSSDLSRSPGSLHPHSFLRHRHSHPGFGDRCIGVIRCLGHIVYS